MAVLGVDLGGTNVRAGLVEGGRLLRVESSRIPGEDSEEAVLEVVFRLIGQLIGPDVQSIGVGVPSVVDLKEGILYDVQNIPSWQKVPLKALLERRYNIPAYVNNDANCFAMGEKYYGKGRPYEHVVGLIIGTGLGAGIIANGKLYSGANCGAGEFGMIPYGNGILEDYASGRFFRKVHGTSGEEAYNKACRGDPEALGMFAEFGGHLGQAVMAVMFAVDPEIIILGGAVSTAYEFFRESLWASVKTFPYSLTVQNIRIEVSDLENVAILGAAALCYDALRA